MSHSSRGQNSSQTTGDTVTDAFTALEQGQLTGEELARLDRMIVEDDAVLQSYVAHVQDSVQIQRHAKLGSNVMFAEAHTPLANAASKHIGTGYQSNHWRLLSASVVACAAGVLLTLWLSRPANDTIDAVLTPAHVESGQDMTSQEVFVATLSGTVDCQWSGGSQVPAYGEPLEAGQSIELAAGVAQITFNDGAKVVLQGPAHFQIESTGSARLNAGKMTALVPVQAVGFRVRTPMAEIVDLGTEFGLVVSDIGDTEVHVFEGEVVVWDPSSERSEPAGRHVQKNEALAIGGANGEMTKLRMDPSQFHREITPRLAKAELPPLTVTENLALWLAADVLVKTDDQGGVIAWRDIVVGDNQSEEDAWQQESHHRPRWIPGAMNDRPAIRFDGVSSFLTTTPLLSTESQTLFLVFSRRDVAMSQFAKRQIINYNGPPYALSPFDGTPMRVLQIDDLFHAGVFRARFYAGGFSVGDVSTTSQIPPNTATLLGYRYDPNANESLLAVNGEVRDRSTAPRWRSYTSRKVIGRHPKQETEMSFFAGDIAEVVIYNDALDDEQFDETTSYLLKKYGLP